MTDCYTVLSFAPVQGFIEKSRKLRDLFGSSYILSYLADQLCQAARSHLIPDKAIADDLTWPDDPVISPARIRLAQGTPNQIVIRGHFPEDVARRSFDQAWGAIVEACREWIEEQVPHKPDNTPWKYTWQREWNEWNNHAWEFFWAIGTGIDEAFVALNQVKRSRNWTGVNWTGESSTLSGADARAWPDMAMVNPKTRNATKEDATVTEFYTQLSSVVGESIITPREQLSIPELVKRLITLNDIANRLYAAETPVTFRSLSRWDDTEQQEENRESDRQDEKRWTGWFQGDGDKVGDYLRGKTEEERYHFSHSMREWGLKLPTHLPNYNQMREVVDPKTGDIKRTKDADGRIIYAGGDDFLGVLYRNYPQTPLTAIECLRWLYTFKTKIWSRHNQPIKVSVGFVWAGPNVPQREILQQCRLAEKAAKDAGKNRQDIPSDRVAIRILFNSGTQLQWICPWWFLEPVIEGYRDRNGVLQSDVTQGGQPPNWTHLYNDVAALESRHAFEKQTDVALGLFELYFGEENRALLEKHQWKVENDDRVGILGNEETDCDNRIDALNSWIVNLAEVGFHLCSDQPKTAIQPDDGSDNDLGAIAA